MQRLTNLCSLLNDMEPICVLNHVFVLREVSHTDFFLLSKHTCCFLAYHGPLKFLLLEDTFLINL